MEDIGSYVREAKSWIYDVTGLELTTCESFELARIVREIVANDKKPVHPRNVSDPALDAVAIFLDRNYCGSGSLFTDDPDFWLLAMHERRKEKRFVEYFKRLQDEYHNP